jgi:hypothetical protein
VAEVDTVARETRGAVKKISFVVLPEHPQAEDRWIGDRPEKWAA